MRESQFLKRIAAEGEQKGEVKRARADLLRLLQASLGMPPPEPVRLAVEGTSDLGILDRWFDAALVATSWAELQAAMQSP